MNKKKIKKIINKRSRNGKLSRETNRQVVKIHGRRTSGHWIEKKNNGTIIID